MTAELLSRIQFAFTISFHILFPAFSIGLATFLAIMEGAWLKTKNPIYMMICRFWMKVFAITFGMGVVSGIVMEFQLGTNWAGFTQVVGPVLGSLFTYEVLTAFFIEAGFLGVMIFGWNKVGPRLHYGATLLVFFGVTLSAFWIMSANSWMQTPSGATIVNHHFVVNSWLKVIFNPSVLVRFVHMLLAAYLTTLFVIAGVTAYYLIKKIHFEFAKKCFSFAMWAIIILIPLQIYMGDANGREVLQNQPIKTAAMEAVWKTQNGAPFLIFAIPDDKAEKKKWAIGIPHAASLINTHQWDGKLQGLDSVKPSDQPYVPIVFFSFRIMVAVGMLMLLVGLYGLWLRYRRKLYDQRWFLRTCVILAPMGFIALLTGWFTAETGRQPWIVYGLLRTADAVSPIHVRDVIISFILLFMVYGVIFGVFYFRYLFKVFKEGPALPKDHRQPFGYLPQPEEKK
jgi:cytochrome d ubiquinol oxidase subunit I